MHVPRGVSFSSTVRCIEIMSIYDYTPEEISAAWFSQEEMDIITSRCLKIIQKIEIGGAEAQRKYCFRGLESHSTLGRIGKQQNRLASVSAVLTEQARQWDENYLDDQAIANAYQNTTSSCQMWAQVVGKGDQDIAGVIHCEDEDEAEDDVATAAITTYSSIDNKSTGEPDIKNPSQRSARRFVRRAQCVRAAAA